LQAASTTKRETEIPRFRAAALISSRSAAEGWTGLHMTYRSDVTYEKISIKRLSGKERLHRFGHNAAKGNCEE